MDDFIQKTHLCKDLFWDSNKTWYTDQPKLTRCLSQVGFSILPFLLVTFLILIEFVNVHYNKSKKISLNKYNFFRYALCILLIASNIYLVVNYVLLIHLNDFLKPSDYLSAFCKLLFSIFLLLIFHYHRLNGIKTSAIVWIILFIQTVCSFILFFDTIFYNSQMYLSSEHSNIKTNFICYFVLFFINTVYSDSESKRDKKKKENRLIDNIELEIDEIEDDEVRPRSNCSFFSRITFIYLSEFIALSKKITVDIDKVFHLDKYMKVNFVVNNFEKEYLKEKEKIRIYNEKHTKKKEMDSLNIIKVGFKVYGKIFYYTNFIKLVMDLSAFLRPILLKLMIDFVTDQTIPKWHGLLIVISFVSIGLIRTILYNYYYETTYSIGLNFKTSLMNLVFSKTLKINSEAKGRRTTGEIINLISVDVCRFQEIIPFLSAIWSSPMQIILAVYLIYTELGVSVFAGVSLIFLIMILNSFIITYLKNFYLKEMTIKDDRIKIMNEILSGIRVIKLYGWETPFKKNVTNLREKEVKQIRKYYLLELVNFFLFEISPTLVMTLTLTIFTYLNNTVLTPQKIFVSIALFNLLQFPIDILPSVISYLTMCKVSLSRISSFLKDEELENYVKHDYDSENAISIKGNAFFNWNSNTNTQPQESNLTESNSENKQKSDQNFQLKNINLEIKKGTIVAIVGKVGSSGKSSLINAILGEMNLIENKEGSKGVVNISNDQKISYVSQQAWIQNCTLKDNVLFGRQYCELKYSETLKACALAEDLKSLPNGDETEIGDKGINLSGGQKQRVSLARAAYSDSNLIILDDPLSAVDIHVSKHLMKNLLSSESGLLKNTTRVLVTNQINLLDCVDQVIVLENGCIALNCSIDEFRKLKDNGELDKFDLKFDKNQDASKDEKKTEKNKLDDKLVEKFDKKTNKEKEEKVETGRVDLKNYFIYLKNVGYISCTIVFLGFFVENFFALFANIILSIWTSVVSQHIDKKDIEKANKHYLLAYIGISLAQCVFELIACIIFVYGVIRSLKMFHEKLLHKIIRSKMKFFDITPIGRIINRFSKDIESIDKTIPYNIRDFLPFFLRILVSFVLIIYKIPSSFFFFVILIILYYRIQDYYVGSSRQVRRLESNSRSPILSQFGETINGCSTIRAFKKTSSFTTVFNNKMEINNRCYYFNLLSNRWLSLRLDCLGVLILFIITIYTIFYREEFDGGQIGLIMSYSMNITDYFNWIVRTFCSIETNAVSIERIHEYINNEEEDQLEKDFKPVSTWPQGSIEFVNYSTSYGDDLVLNNLSLKINSQDRVGIVGRTGAGKSSLTSALFRIIEPTNGKILIDNVDINKIGLNMRSKLSIIPQDPVIFTGTIRFNLDPFDNYTDDEVWKSIELASLKDFISSLDKGIFYEVSEGGSNLSVGQKQLLCLARALLKKSKILILDEATASIDFATDEIIQKTIREEFKNSTILTIAHRINTILDYDKVLVLEKGKVVEYDRTEVLLKNPESYFYKMAREANLI